MNINFQGFHGTSFEKSKNIILNEFKPSLGDPEWLGDGVYFFVEGLSNKPKEQAQKWAIAQSWDNLNKVYKYKRIGVIKSNIEVEDDNFLDLTTNDGIEILDYIIERHSDMMKSIGRKIVYVDGLAINLARKENILPLEVVKGNFYIKFTKERTSNINRRTSNCTICSVYLPTENIKTKELVLTSEII